MAQLSKCVSHKLEELSMKPQDPYSIGVGTRQRQEEPWSLMVSQPSQMDEPSVHRKDPSSKNKRAIKEDTQPT